MSTFHYEVKRDLHSDNVTNISEHIRSQMTPE